MWQRRLLLASIGVTSAAALYALGGSVPAGQAGAVQAQSPRARAEELGRRATERIRALEREAEALASQERTLLRDLRQLEIERDLRAEELRQIEPELAALGAEVRAATAQVRDLERALASAQPLLAARLVDVYKLGRAGYLRLWLSAADLRSIGRAVRVASALARIHRDQVADYQTTRARLVASTAELERRAVRLADLQGRARQARIAAEAAVAAHAALIRQIDERRDLTAQLLGELQQSRARLQQVIASLSEAADQPSVLEAELLPIRAFRGDLDWPAAGKVAIPFGRRQDARLNAAVITSGIEIAAPEGSPVQAIHEGTVALADVFSGFGHLVIVDHGNQAYSLYGYLASLEVTRGSRVRRGQMLGTVGRGTQGRPALYFELRIDGQPVDPVQWLRPVNAR